MTVTSRIQAMLAIESINAKLSASVDAYPDESNNDVLISAKAKWVLRNADGERASISVLPMDRDSYRRRFWGGHYPYTREERHLFLPYRHGQLVHVARAHPQPWVANSLNKVIRFCSGIRYYGASQFTNPSACPVSFEIEMEGTRSRPSRLRGHAKVLYQMYLAKKDPAGDKYEQFVAMVGPKGLRLIDDISFREFATSSIDYDVRVGGKLVKRRLHKLLIIPRFRIGRHRLSPNQLSEGTFKTLALLFYIMTEEGKALLIEEPEVCIHHGLLASILELVRDYSTSKQMIVTTHSDYVLEHVSPENVFQVRRDKLAGTIVKHITKAMTRGEYSALRHYLETEGNLGEYWREGGLDD